MNRLDKLFKQLGYNYSNGLCLLKDSDNWMQKFPYRLGRVLRDIIRPYAFYSPFQGERSTEPHHPETLNNPIILFFDTPGEDVRKDIPRWTFCFGQAPIVIINKDDYTPLEICHGYSFDGRDREWLKKIDANDIDISDFSVFALSTGKTWEKLYQKYFKGTSKVDKYLLKNIVDARRILIAKNTGGLSPGAANRLIGRLLFVRYLIDRDVAFENARFIKGETKNQRQTSLEHLLKNKEEIYLFFESITRLYNGDLFPLVEKNERGGIVYDEKEEVEQKHLDIMYYLFTCSEFFSETHTWNGYEVQQSLFNFYDFAVIPVELLSNIYENFLAEPRSKENLGDLSKQKEIKAYYTPPFLVDFILSQTVTPHLAAQNVASCKVLDPSCGSGIFLVETLRKLIEKEMVLKKETGTGNKPGIPDDRLWQIVHENIFGIDIDDDAIEITIFSIYITLLDYKAPREIKSFRFKKLKNKNLFGGPEADFFNESHPFNKLLAEETALDFIIGNPPWGNVGTSKYKDYIDNKNRMGIQEGKIPLEISNDEISQAFMIRTEDFSGAYKKTECAFVVTGKNLYNADAANWRNYFLNNFCISMLFELSSLNNKNTGGPKLFENARQAPVVVFFHPRHKNDVPANSLITHATARANYYWDCFKTIIIEKPDVKRILQRYFIPSKGGDDWLWKVLLHGNILDFKFIKRLKENHLPFSKLMEQLNLTFKGGLKAVDNSIPPEKRKCTGELRNFKYLEIDKRGENGDFRRLRLAPSKTFDQKLSQWVARGKISGDKKVAQLPDTYFFKGKKLLLKNGLTPFFKAFAAVCDEDLAYTHSICSIKPIPGKPSQPDVHRYLHTIAGLINSDLFTYFVFNAGTSAGVGRTRANFIDFFNFPIQPDKKIGIIAEKLKRNYETLDLQLPGGKNDLEKKIQKSEEELRCAIINNYDISKEEAALIDYAVNIAIPVYKKKTKKRRGAFGVLDSLSLKRNEDKNYLKKYAGVFIAHFGQRFTEDEKYFVVDIHATPAFVGFHFKITRKPGNDERIFFKEDTDVEEMVNKIGGLGYHKLSKDLYICQDVRGFNESSFYVIKPNQKKSWHEAVAYADLSEFIDSLVKAEIKKRSA